MVTVRDFRVWSGKNPNFMTPMVLRVEQVGDWFIELSEGTGFEHEPLYGVSIILWDGGEFTTVHKLDKLDLSKSFRDKNEAVAHFNSVKRIVGEKG